MPRGGRRSGTPGKSYGQRGDLNSVEGRPPITRVPGQPYGAQAQQVRDQRSVPVGPQPAPMVPQPPLAGAVAAPPTGTPLIPLDAPTARPNEPLTAGVNIGPGPGAPGPRVLSTDDPAIAELRGIYLAFPNEDLRELLEDYDTGRMF